MASAAILGCRGPRLDRGERAFFADAQPWGFILFARNVEEPGQLRRLTGALREAVGRDAPVLVDQEGGRVQRMGPPHWRQWPPPLEAARAGPRAMELRFRIVAEELRAVGIDVNCAPMADIARDGTHPFLRNRCYGTEPDAVAETGRAVARALLAGGVLPVVKHMPGHGLARTDSHLRLPVAEASREELRAADFAPFRALNDIAMGMTAHVVYRSYDSERPATQSPVVIDAIRREIGFAGLLMTDDISMNALSGSPGERARASRSAGCDIVLHCNGERAEMEEIVDGAGALEGEGLARAGAALAGRRAPEPFDLAAAEAELARLAR